VVGLAGGQKNEVLIAFSCIFKQRIDIIAMGGYVVSRADLIKVVISVRFHFSEYHA